MNKLLSAETLATLLNFLAGLAPGAFGAGVALAYEKTLTWGQRFTQFAVGIIVSYFVRAALTEWTTLGEFTEQGIAFTVGMVAFKSVPAFIGATAETARSIPGDLWAAIKSKLGIGQK